MDLNLDTLKREILDYLESRDLAVFRSTPGTLEDPQMVLWDSEHHPDYRMFLDAAIKTGVKMILFATRGPAIRGGERRRRGGGPLSSPPGHGAGRVAGGSAEIGRL